MAARLHNKVPAIGILAFDLSIEVLNNVYSIASRCARPEALARNRDLHKFYSCLSSFGYQRNSIHRIRDCGEILRVLPENRRAR